MVRSDRNNQASSQIVQLNQSKEGSQESRKSSCALMKKIYSLGIDLVFEDSDKPEEGKADR